MAKKKENLFSGEKRNHKESIVLTFPQVAAILSALAGGVGLFVLHNFEQISENVRHIDNSHQENIRALLQRSAEETKAFREEMKAFRDNLYEHEKEVEKIKLSKRNNLKY